LQNAPLPRHLRDTRSFGVLIMTEVRRQAPQLTVLGTQGLTGFRRALIGSVAEAALGDLPCDVLAVPPKRD
ncbi:universal stress protein, partial [Pseudomonas aeruginosa]|uniref:universal stress protein n=1 Tax=Pseudomonas aeruginosa TaxID=287 RepID=UPI00396817F5